MREQIEDFYKANHNLYVKRLSRQAGSPSNAEDVVQEAFLRALQYSDSYTAREDQDMEKWFNSILRRALVDFMRVETKQGMTSQTDTGATEEVYVSRVDQLTAEEIEGRINNYANPLHRQVLFLFFLRNYKPKDICMVLDAKSKNVEQILQRFKKEMREIYEGYRA